MKAQPVTLSGDYDPTAACTGFCARCGVEHSLTVGHARGLCLELMRELEAAGRIDIDVPDADADPRLSLDYIQGPALGQMFGVLVCRDGRGENYALKAFSGQYNGIWHVSGWAPPLIDETECATLTFPVERRIKALGTEIESLPEGSGERRAKTEERKALSQGLMRDIHDLYGVRNSRGERVPLRRAFIGDGGIPTGTGDCCAPKLLDHAFNLGLTPLGLAEFYMGRTNRSGTRRHGEFYPSCEDKCGRILGFMLCGLE